MTKRQAVPAAPGPLEDYAAAFDQLLAKANQRHAFRQYLEGLLVPCPGYFVHPRSCELHARVR